MWNNYSSSSVGPLLPPLLQPFATITITVWDNSALQCASSYYCKEVLPPTALSCEFQGIMGQLPGQLAVLLLPKLLQCKMIECITVLL